MFRCPEELSGVSVLTVRSLRAQASTLTQGEELIMLSMPLQREGVQAG